MHTQNIQPSGIERSEQVKQLIEAALRAQGCTDTIEVTVDTLTSDIARGTLKIGKQDTE